jgi:hypothetical protein
MKSFARMFAALMLIALSATLPGCSPDKAMDFGTNDRVTTAPPDELSRQILHDFDGREFTLGNNDRQAEVRLADWPAGKRIVIPFWLGVNPVMPFFHRPSLGHIYVISESYLVRQLDATHYLIRAGSSALKTDTVFESTHTRYLGAGKMLPTVVRFVGTEVITVPKDAPATGAVTEKVPILREISLPMHMEYQPRGYAKFEVSTPGSAG